MISFKHISILFCLIGALALCGCNGRVRDTKEAILFCKSTVVLPHEMIAIENGSLNLSSIPQNGVPTLVRYYAPNDCNECAVSHMRDNVALVDFSKKDESFEVVVIMSPPDEDREEIMRKIIELKLPIVVYFDTSYYLESLGVIPKNSALHSFLLDKDGHPVFLGNPLKNDASLDRFRKAINR